MGGKHAVRNEKRQKKYVWLSAIIVLAVSINLYSSYTAFMRGDGIDGPIISDEPNWQTIETSSVSSVDYEILNKSRVHLSEMYRIVWGTEVQYRVRFAYTSLFAEDTLFNDTEWLLIDSDGNNYTGKIAVYFSESFGFQCVNVAVIFEESEYRALEGKELFLTIVCTDKENFDITDSYAYCELKFSAFE